MANKNKIWICSMAILILSQLYSCKKDSEVSLAELTTTVSKITQSTAICVGNLSSTGGGTITEKGFCWGTNQNPTVDQNKTIVKSDSIHFKDTITGLNPNITYYVRSYSINSKGIAYGNEQSFTLWINTSGPNVSDVDGNSYTSVKIGSQVWMVQNLRTTKYRNGELIGTTTPDSLDTRNEINPKYQWVYKGYEDKVAKYGRLYTWNAVSDSRNIAPTGWHVATQEDWNKLIDYLGGAEIAGGKLKDTSLINWNSPNKGATNESGFTAVSTGYRAETGYFFNLFGYRTYWWTSTKCSGCSVSGGIDFSLNYDFNSIGWESDYSNIGSSVRCVMD